MTFVDTNLFIYAVGRAFDNGFCEHLWRSVKYKNIYVNQYGPSGCTLFFPFCGLVIGASHTITSF